MRKLFIIILLIPFFGISQSNYYYPYENHAEFDYLKRTDSIVQKIFKSTNLDIQSPDFQYLKDSTSIKMENSITTNYGFNSKVKFIFEDDNLSYMTKERFDRFRRGFYQEKDLIILISVNEKNNLKKHLKTINYKNLSNWNSTHSRFYFGCIL